MPRIDKWTTIAITIVGAILAVGIAWGAISSDVNAVTEVTAENCLRLEAHEQRLTAIEVSTEGRLARIEEKLDWLILEREQADMVLEREEARSLCIMIMEAVAYLDERQGG